MAGPCVSIFTRQKISSADEDQVRAVVTAMANTVEGDDFWIAGRPFFIKFREAAPEDRELVLDGWTPNGDAGLCAMGNDQVDHILLGALCCRTAEFLDGLIYLGDLSAVTQDPTVLTYEGRHLIDGYGYFVNSKFLAYWMGSPEFRLLK